MTPEESEYFSNLGRVLLGILAQVTTTALIYGIFTLLFAISTRSFLDRGLLNRPARVMFITTIIGFTIATIEISAQVAGFSVLIRGPLVEYLDLPLEVQDDIVNAKLFKTNIILQWTNNIVPIISDCVVIWRAWVLFPERRWVMGVPLFLLLASTGTAFTFLGLISSPSGIISAKLGNNIDYLRSSSLILSMVTNAVTTFFIACKLWAHRKFMINNLGPTRRVSPVQKVLFLLVESGVVYFALQAAYLMLDLIPQSGALGSAADITAYIFASTYFEISAMYPTIVIVLVHSNRSFVDTYEVGSLRLSQIREVPAYGGGGGGGGGPGSRPVTIGHLSFAPPLNLSMASAGPLPDGVVESRTRGNA